MTITATALIVIAACPLIWIWRDEIEWREAEQLRALDLDIARGVATLERGGPYR